MKNTESFVIHFSEPEAAEREGAVWKDIGRTFSIPISANDSTADYAPTQILAEAFRSKGYDGVAYTSAFGNGLNIALFNTSAADLVSCHLFQVKKISFESDEAWNPYFVSKH